MFGSGIKKKRSLFRFPKSIEQQLPFPPPCLPPSYSSPTVSLYHLPKSRICAAMVTAVSRDRLQWSVFPHMLKTRIIDSSPLSTTALPRVQITPRVSLTFIQMCTLVLAAGKISFFYVHFCVVFWSMSMHPIIVIVWLLTCFSQCASYWF